MHSSVHVVYVSDVVQGGVIDSSQLVSPAQWQTSQKASCLPRHTQYVHTKACLLMVSWVYRANHSVQEGGPECP